MKSKRNLIILTLVIAISLIGVTYAFFDYYMLGANQKITAGKVNLILNEGEDTINRSNIFPETKEKARSRTDNFITFTVSGVNTTEDQDIYYEIMLNEGDPETGMTRFDARDLVFDLVELDEDGNEGTYLVDALSYNDFNERRIWVNTVDRNTSLTVEKTYKLRMWLSEDIKISNSNPFADYPATGYENHYASVKVSVYGDFVEKQQPYNYMANLGTPEVVTETETISATFWPESIENVKANITEVNFISIPQNSIDTRYEIATIKEDVSDATKSGSVKAWLENGELVTAEDGTETQYYKMYVASEGITFFPSDSRNMFRQFTNLTSINFENVSTKYTEDFMGMFEKCSNLIELDLSNFDTKKVTNMRMMFEACGNLTNLNISNFDTSSVTNMVYMFANCSKLVELDVSKFNTSDVEDMYGMFMGCGTLTELNVTNFDTSKVTRMEYMFANCYKLTSLDLNNFNTSKVTNMGAMFLECRELTTLNIDNFDTSQVTNMNIMFNGCQKLIKLNLSSFDTSDVTTMRAMFKYCTKLTELDLTNFNIQKVKNTKEMFYGNSALTTIYANSDWNTATITDSTTMFTACSKLVGAISYTDTTLRDITVANPINGFFTKKEA